MEYLGGGSALDLMKAGQFEEMHIGIILREVLKGLDYLHSERKLHRDIKGEHLFLFTRYFCSPLSFSGQRLALGERRREAGRLRRGRPADQHHQQAQHIRGHTVLDGAGGDKTICL